MSDIYKNIAEYNTSEKRKILIVFDDMITDILSNKTLNPIVTELFIRRKTLNINTIVFWKFQINKNFNKLHSIIHYRYC